MLGLCTSTPSTQKEKIGEGRGRLQQARFKSLIFCEMNKGIIHWTSQSFPVTSYLIKQEVKTLGKKVLNSKLNIFTCHKIYWTLEVHELE